MTAQQPAKVTCPVCGREVDPAVAPSLKHRGRTYYFECQRCLQRFALAPELFVGYEAARQTNIGEPTEMPPSHPG